jgi:hypothetical protein
MRAPLCHPHKSCRTYTLCGASYSPAHLGRACACLVASVSDLRQVDRLHAFYADGEASYRGINTD